MMCLLAANLPVLTSFRPHLHTFCSSEAWSDVKSALPKGRRGWLEAFLPCLSWVRGYNWRQWLIVSGHPQGSMCMHGQHAGRIISSPAQWPTQQQLPLPNWRLQALVLAS